MKLGILIALIFVLGACSSTTKKEARTFKKSYEVVDAKTPIIPDWLEDPQEKNGDAQKMRNEHRYYVSSTEDMKNKRLCIRSSQARATALIASEITQLLKDQYTESTQASGGDDGENEIYMSETLANEVMAYLTGVSTINQYWEKRRYSKELGAEEDHASYACWSLVRIPVKVLKNAIREAQKKFVDGQKDPEVKEKAQKALKDVENKLDKIM